MDNRPKKRRGPITWIIELSHRDKLLSLIPLAFFSALGLLGLAHLADVLYFSRHW